MIKIRFVALIVIFLLGTFTLSGCTGDIHNNITEDTGINIESKGEIASSEMANKNSVLYDPGSNDSFEDNDDTITKNESQYSTQTVAESYNASIVKEGIDYKVTVSVPQSTIDFNNDWSTLNITLHMKDDKLSFEAYRDVRMSSTVNSILLIIGLSLIGLALLLSIIYLIVRAIRPPY